MNASSGEVMSKLKTIAKAFIPTKTQKAKIRFDSIQGKWAIIQPDGSALEHFDYAIMSNVTFSHEIVSKKSVGCGGREDIDYAGFAEGDLCKGKCSISIVGLKALGFDKATGGFRASNGSPISGAKYLYLQPSRHAFYAEE